MNCDIHKIPKYNTKRVPRCFDELVIPLHVAHTHLPALSHLACIVGVREGVIAPFLASVTDNGFKTVCQMIWVISV